MHDQKLLQLFVVVCYCCCCCLTVSAAAVLPHAARHTALACFGADVEHVSRRMRNLWAAAACNMQQSTQVVQVQYHNAACTMSGQICQCAKNTTGTTLAVHST